MRSALHSTNTYLKKVPHSRQLRVLTTLRTAHPVAALLPPMKMLTDFEWKITVETRFRLSQQNQYS